MSSFWVPPHITGIGTLSATATTTLTGGLVASSGGTLTGTWTDLGTVTTVDLNGGSIDGVIIGGASAGAGTFTTVTASGVVDIFVGSAAAPSLAFTGDPDTGFYSLGANQFGFAVNGASVMQYNPGGGWNFTGTNRVEGPQGSATFPGYTFNDDNNTGVYRSGADVLGFAAGGVQRMRVNGAQLDLLNSTLVNVGASTNDWDANFLTIGAAQPGAGSLGLVFGDGIALGSMAVDTAGIYADNVGTTTEMFAIDEAGSVTQLSNHPAAVLAQSSLLCLMHPGAISSENVYLGKRVTVDWCGVLLALEQLTGQTFMVFEDLPLHRVRDWDADQERRRLQREADRDDALAWRTQLLVRWTASEDPDERGRILDVLATIKVPDSYTKERPPQWLQDRGVVSSLP